MRGQQYLAAIRTSAEGALVLETLYYADEVRSAEDQVPKLPQRNGSAKKEREMATQLVDSMTDSWDPTEFPATYRERVDELVESKRKGEQNVEEGEPPESTNVVDLMDALQRSVSEARGEQGTDLAELSKKDLDAEARDLGVRGRSKMNRGELEKAVRDASRSGRKKAS